MNAAQVTMYFAEFGRLRARLKAQGKTGSEIEEVRHRITRDALGVTKSSKEFTNDELDRVLARIAALVDAGDLNTQLALQDSPDVRRAGLRRRIDRALAVIVAETGSAEKTRFVRERYAEATARRIAGSGDLATLAVDQLGKVMGALERSAAIKRRKAAAGAGAGNGEGNPF